MTTTLANIADKTRGAAVVALLLILAAGTSRASNGAPPGKDNLRFSAAVASVLQAASGLDGGGELRVYEAMLKTGLEKRWGRALSGGVSLDYGRSRFDFDRPAAFGGQAPWETVHTIGFGTKLQWSPERSWSLMVRPGFKYALEEGADWDDAAVASVAASVSRRFGRGFSLGVGFAASSGLEEDDIHPLVVVFWRISERWRLANPFRPGPTSPAGLELSYRADKRSEVGFGTTYVSQRFRLDERAPAPGGIGETSAFVSYLRLSRQLWVSVDLDLYAGMRWESDVTLEDSDGRELAGTEYGPAALFALSLQGRF